MAEAMTSVFQDQCQCVTVRLCLCRWAQPVCVWGGGLLVIYSHTSQIKGQRQLPGHLDLGHPGGTSSPVGALKRTH